MLGCLDIEAAVLWGFLLHYASRDATDMARRIRKSALQSLYLQIEDRGTRYRSEQYGLVSGAQGDPRYTVGGERREAFPSLPLHVAFLCLAMAFVTLARGIAWCNGMFNHLIPIHCRRRRCRRTVNGYGRNLQTSA